MSFKISLIVDNENNVFRSGENISGKVYIRCPKEKAIFEWISVKLVGEAKVHFIKKDSVDYKKMYTDKKVLLGQTIILTDNRDTLDLPKLYCAEHKFSFTLPQNLPSSSKWEFGKVKYYAVAEIKRRDKSFVDSSEKHVFTVEEILDLNEVPISKLPVAETLERGRLGVTSSKGVIACRVEMPKTGYANGEKLEIAVEIDNKSIVAIKTSATLTQHVDFLVKGPISVRNKAPQRKTKYWEVKCVDGPKVNAGEKTHWTVDNLMVTGLPPSTIEKYAIINVQYQLEVQIRPSGLEKLSLKIPIIIGTIPVTQDSHNRNKNSNGNFNANFQPSFRIFNDYSDLPPPSYEDATK